MAHDLFKDEPAPPKRRDRLYRWLLNRGLNKAEAAHQQARAKGDKAAELKATLKAKRALDGAQAQKRRETARRREVYVFEERDQELEVWINLNGSASVAHIPFQEALKVADHLEQLPKGQGLRLDVSYGGYSEVLVIPKDVVPDARQRFSDWARAYRETHSEPPESTGEVRLSVITGPRSRLSGLAERRTT